MVNGMDNPKLFQYMVIGAVLPRLMTPDLLYLARPVVSGPVLQIPLKT